MSDTVFCLDEAAFKYSGSPEIFSNISLSIHAGDSVCLLGANGSGKSTLLKIFCGLLFPFAGSFKAFGQEMTEDLLEDSRYARKYHRRVGFIFQNADVQLFNTRVWDEIAYGPRQLGYGEEEIKTRVHDIMDLLKIRDLSDRSPYRLSGGEKKKVAVASVLVLNPEVLILDEPTNGLDPKTQRWLVDLMLELNRQGRTIITATHDLNLAHALSSRALILSEDHRLVYDGPSHEALGNKDLLISVNLIDEYFHVHGAGEHVHRYNHG